MAITDKLFETNSELEKIAESAGKTIPEAGERTDIVSHLNYTLDLLKAMVSSETAAEADAKLASGFNGIQDKLEVINFLLASGELPASVEKEIIPETTLTFVSTEQNSVYADLLASEYGADTFELGKVYEFFFDGESLGIARCEYALTGPDMQIEYQTGKISVIYSDATTFDKNRIIYLANDEGDHTVRVVKIA